MENHRGLALAMDAKKKHGGKRSGSGRPANDESGRGKGVLIYLSPGLLTVVDAEAKSLGINRSELIRNALLGYLSE